MKRPIDDIANWQLQQENTSKPFPYIFPQMPPRFQRWCVFAKVVFLIQRGCFAVFCLGSMMLLVPVIIFGKDLKLSVMTDNHPFLALLVMATAVSLLLFFLAVPFGFTPKLFWRCPCCRHPFPYYVPTRGDYRKAAETGPKNPRTGRPMWNLDMRRKEDPWRADRCLFGVWIC